MAVTIETMAGRIFHITLKGAADVNPRALVCIYLGPGGRAVGLLCISKAPVQRLRYCTNRIVFVPRIERENNKSPATTGGRKKQAAVRSNGQIASVEPPPQQQTGKFIQSYCEFPLLLSLFF
ncbi:hypothetical protein RR46_06608 [Papilio xuthus]|uniref:Uncharacterized protein n=1 Tax=Papilio xuthus TaxID=66420 RepID=A0A194PLF2_PAPXU|nr:hypothetical protein RR46_06608 [Papilio xuthus]